MSIVTLQKELWGRLPTGYGNHTTTFKLDTEAGTVTCNFPGAEGNGENVCGKQVDYFGIRCAALIGATTADINLQIRYSPPGSLGKLSIEQLIRNHWHEMMPCRRMVSALSARRTQA